MSETHEFNFSIPDGLPPSARADDGVMRLLVISMGDFTHTINTLPLLRLLTKNIKDIHLGVVTTDKFSELLATYMSINKVHALDSSEFCTKNILGGYKYAKEQGRNFADSNYTVIFDTNSTPESSTFTLATSKSLRIGFAPPVGTTTIKDAYTHRVLPSGTSSHPAEQMMALAKIFGVDSSSCEFDGFELDDVDTSSPTFGGNKYILLDINNADAASLPNEYYAELASILSRTYDCDIVITSEGDTDDYAQRFEAISDSTSARCHLLVGISPLEIALLTRNAISVFGPNNGMLHLASALGAPTITFLDEKNSKYAPIFANNMALTIEDTPNTKPEVIAQKFALLWRSIVDEPLKGVRL